MTFSLATNPPGGVVQASLDDEGQCITRVIKNKSKLICVGEAILASYKHDAYLKFLICNTICFIASLSIILFLVSGIPLNRPFPVWLLSIGMCITLTSLSLTYLFAANMVTPDSLWKSVDENAFGIALIVWVAIVSILAIILIVRLFVRVVYKCLK
ncbi:ankyrin repeat protein [Trifolium medium]|uniref:Ankyrin repeat protein n=1 Tax=Trifolium medium TaxID=97028 RepID=A0A392PKP9_9FABA|nr:ankyrin repeat protein [Trifolium medium]